MGVLSILQPPATDLHLGFTAPETEEQRKVFLVLKSSLAGAEVFVQDEIYFWIERQVLWNNNRISEQEVEANMAAHVSESEEYREALRMFDEAHREDPRRVTVRGEEVPWSLLYHRRLHHWVERLADPASESLLLAARCQHIRRWRIPRSDYPMDRTGYRRWRKTLLRFHAEQAREILEQAGYEEKLIRRVQELVQKLRLKLDPEVQLFEDAICLVFLENEFVDFLGKHEEDKIIEILQQTWKKMSRQGHQAALELVETLPPDARRVVGKAL